MQTVFLSDVHLESGRADVTSQFFDYLENLSAETDRLYIVGDLFEAWIGDDAPGPLGEHTIEQLAQLSNRGIRCYFTHGNRDFLIGEEFAEQTGFTLLGDEHIVDCYGEPVLLMHGDSLCVDDIEYQALRKTVRDPQWQAHILGMSVEQRLALAQGMRRQSSTQMSNKPADIMDVNADAVATAFRRHDVNYLLHGHTHRPAVHKLSVDERPRERIVLGDWYTQGSVVTWSESGFELVQLPR